MVAIVTKAFDWALKKEQEITPFLIPSYRNKFFIIIPADMPYGLTTEEGSLLLAPGRNGGVVIQGWQIWGDDWRYNSSSVMWSQYSDLIYVRGQESVWRPALSNAHENPGREFVGLSTPVPCRFDEFVKRWTSLNN